MDAEIKEKLIDLVRKYKCLYEPKDKNYKNTQYKTLLWQNIGRQLNIDGEIAKKLWRSVRDGYMRHKRLLKQQTGSARKDIQYVWKEQMAFIDGSLELRPTSSNVTETLSEYSNDSDAPGLLSFNSPPQPSPSPSVGWSPMPDPPGLLSFCLPPQLSPPLLPTTGLSSMPEPPVTTSLLLSPQPQLATPPSQPRPNFMASKKRGLPSIIEEREDKILEYLNNKRTKRTLDGVDHLFMSYADTFKKLPIIQQTQLKVELAKLFANAELNALGSSPQQKLPVVMLSPAYSFITQDSDITENLISVVGVPVDLSNNDREMPENNSPAGTGEDDQ